MSQAYAARGAAPRTLTPAEQKRLLRASGKRADDYADHIAIALVLATGLRIHELCALNMGQVFNEHNHARQRVTLDTFKGSASGEAAPQDVFVRDDLRKKLDRFLGWKRRRGEAVDAAAPLLCARGGRRLSVRRLRQRFADWRKRAELHPRIKFHAMRHTFCQRLYEQERDLLIVQRAARHANVRTTETYAKPSDADVLRALNDME